MKTIRPRSGLPEGGNRGAGFTLTELVVVLATVALLIIVCLPVLAGTKDQTKIAQCAGNLRQLALTLHIYGNEYADKLPAAGAGFWIWDLDGKAANVMFGGPDFQKFCYCPGTSFRFDDTDNFRLWWWVNGGVPGANASYRVLGYALTLNYLPLIATNVNISLEPQSIKYGPIISRAQPPSQRVLVADATISLTAQHNPNLKYSGGYNYVDIAGSYLKHHLSAHLNGTTPAGGNVGMLDGHVEWRKFADMTVRGYGGDGGAGDNGTCPTFWW